MLVPELNEWYQQYLINLIEIHAPQCGFLDKQIEHFKKEIERVNFESLDLTLLYSDTFQELSSSTIVDSILTSY